MLNLEKLVVFQRNTPFCVFKFPKGLDGGKAETRPRGWSAFWRNLTTETDFPALEAP